MGALYQLPVGSFVGQYVRVDGPWDAYGQVIKLNENGYHLIRGLGHKKPLEML